MFREKALGFHGGSAGKESACIVEDLDSIPGLERFPGEGNDYPLQYSCLENSMERGTWQATWGCKETQLSDSHFQRKRGELYTVYHSQDMEAT